MNSHDNREDEEYQGNRQAPRPGVLGKSFNNLLICKKPDQWYNSVFRLFHLYISLISYKELFQVSSLSDNKYVYRVALTG